MIRTPPRSATWCGKRSPGVPMNIEFFGIPSLSGLSEVLEWMEHLSHELGDSKYRPCPLLRRLVRAGRLGMRSGHGVFLYDDRGTRIPAKERELQ